jgi:hypothetical protein
MKAAMLQTHHNLPKVTEKDIRENGTHVIRDSDQGIQTVVVGDDHKTVRAIVGLNCARLLPNPDPDPMDEIMALAVELARKENK